MTTPKQSTEGLTPEQIQEWAITDEDIALLRTLPSYISDEVHRYPKDDDALAGAYNGLTEYGDGFAEDWEDDENLPYRIKRTEAGDALLATIDRLSAPLSETAKENGVSDDPPRRDKVDGDSEPSAADALLREIISDSLNNTGNPARYSVDARLLTRASNLLSGSCDKCNGSGDHPANDELPCDACDGNGYVESAADQKPAPLPVSDGGLAATLEWTDVLLLRGLVSGIEWCETRPDKIGAVVRSNGLAALKKVLADVCDTCNGRRTVTVSCGKNSTTEAPCKCAANQSTHPVSDGVREAARELSLKATAYLGHAEPPPLARPESTGEVNGGMEYTRTDTKRAQYIKAHDELIAAQDNLAAALALPVQVQAEDGEAALTAPGRDKADASSEPSAADGPYKVGDSYVAGILCNPYLSQREADLANIAYREGSAKGQERLVDEVNNALHEMLRRSATVCVTLFGDEEADDPYGFAAYPKGHKPADPRYHGSPIEAVLDGGAE